MRLANPESPSNRFAFAYSSIRVQDLEYDPAIWPNGPEPFDRYILVNGIPVFVLVSLELLLPDVGAEHDEMLESLVLADGCFHERFVVWRASDDTHILIDGHRRECVWRRHQEMLREPDFDIKDFASRAEAEQHMRDVLQSRRSFINDTARVWFKMQDQRRWDTALAEARAQAKANQKRSAGRGKKGKSRIDRPFTVDQAMADHCGVRTTAYKTIKRALGAAGDDHQWRSKLLNGDLTPWQAVFRIDEANKKQRRDDILARDVEFTNPNLDDGVKNQIVCGRAQEKLGLLPDGCGGFVMTSITYNVGKTYGRDAQGNPIKDSEPYEDWRASYLPLWQQAHRVLRSCGRMMVNIDAVSARSLQEKMKWKKRPVEWHLIEDIIAAGFRYRYTIHWLKKHASGQQNQFGSVEDPNVRTEIEYLLVFDQDERKFKPQDPNQVLDFKRSELETEKFSVSPWIIPADTNPYGGHPCVYPEELVYRAIKMFCPYRRELVIDPMCGSGTTLAVAKKLGRYYFGVDLSPTWCSVAQERCDGVHEGDPIRGNTTGSQEQRAGTAETVQNQD